MNTVKILAVDDEESITFTLKNKLKDYTVMTYNDPESALNGALADHFDIIITDQIMPKMSGLELLEKLKQRCNHPFASILLSGYIDKNLAEAALNSELIDFMADKPIEFDGLNKIIVRSLSRLETEVKKNESLESFRRTNAELNTDLIQYKNMLSQSLVRYGDIQIVAHDKTTKALIEMAGSIAKSGETCLINGESGSGKEIFAYLLHSKSPRHDKPYIKVNCSAIPETLFESELFGHESGAYTGATKSKPGKFELAQGGTIFLDEIGEMPLAQQSKLLRVIEDREITRLGSNKTQKIDVRIICATNRDLLKAADDGLFRKDLFFRISSLKLNIPPLRERKEDIPYLAQYYITKIMTEDGGPEKYLTPDAMEVLKKQPYQGNVRELRNLIYQVYYASAHDVIGADDVKKHLMHSDKAPVSGTGPSALFSELLNKTMPFRDFKNFVESEYLKAQLKIFENNKTQTAQALELDASNLRRKMQDLGISLD